MAKKLLYGVLPLIILCGSVPALAQIKVAEELLVDLRAEDLDYGTATIWINHGSLGDFAPMGTPVVEDVGGRKAISFDGSSYFEGPASVPGIEGDGTRSIEIWAYNGPDFEAEETILSWSRRGGPDGTNIAFNYGNNGTYGAVGHWGAPDMGWSGVHSPAPAAETWWHLVYTYDGATVRLYVNGEANTAEDAALNTHGGLPIRVAAQADGTGASADQAFNFTGSIAEVRIHDGVLSPSDITYNFAGPIQDLSPADGAEHVADVVLSWTHVDAPAGTTYTVHFGANPDMMMPLNTPNTELPLGMVGSPIVPFDTTLYWKVVASDGAQSRLMSFDTEHDRPQFERLEGTSQPASIGLMVGQEGSLACSAATFSGAPVTYQWYMVNPDGDDLLLEGATENILTAVVAEENEGQYYCLATSAAGSTQSNRVMVDIQHGLIHRWTFNDDAVAEVDGTMMLLDVVGGADAALVNGTGNATVADGQVILANTNTHGSCDFAADDPDGNNPDGDYVDLPNGLISSLDAMTVECWSTWDDDERRVWQRIWTFGTSNCGEESSCGAGDPGPKLVALIPYSGSGHLQIETRNPQTTLIPGGHVPLHKEVLVTVTYDDLGSGLYKLFVNGVPLGSTRIVTPLKAIPDNNNWLGRSQWCDPMFVGSFNELRIYDTILSADEIAANYLAGPDTLGVVNAPMDDTPCDDNIVGDVNGDCVVDLDDAAAMIADFLAGD